ncbi:MAG: 50S ribosome-binding GTPase, partial [Oligoflexia bacterium]|nr:50S ribosome-binding GTPase [Oligoflexia bacterium]
MKNEMEMENDVDVNDVFVDETVIISIIGRPNVGKSSIFNRLMRNQELAITHNSRGVTRDLHYGFKTFESKGVLYQTILVDTGGFYIDELKENDPRNAIKKVNKKTLAHITPSDRDIANELFYGVVGKLALDSAIESDLILFVVDIREGLLADDLKIFEDIRKLNKEYFVLVN